MNTKKKFQAISLLTIFVLFLQLLPYNLNTALAAGPDPTTGESRTSLNGTWKLQTDATNVGETNSWFATGFNDSAWGTITVPGNWDTQNATSNYRGKAWYRLNFTAPATYSGFPVRVRFEGVYHHARVWVNGTFVGEHFGGYTPFEFDVTSLLNYGAANVIAVKADSTFSVGAWWPWGGISRDVNLIVNNTTQIEWQKINAVPDLVGGSAALTITARVWNKTAASKTIVVDSKIYDKVSGALLRSSANDANLSKSVTIPANTASQVQLTTTMPSAQVKLWHFDTPNLYKMTTTATESSVVQHQITNNFGIRKIEISGTQFKLNGEVVRLVGFNRVPDSRVYGGTDPNHLLKQDIDLAKSMGANVARLFHAPHDPELLDYLDEKGMLVVAEIPVWGSGYNIASSNYPQTQQWLKEMIERDYNHPSIFAWSPANEIGGTTTNGINYVKAMFDYIRANLDTSRYLTYASNTAWNATSSTGDAAQWCDFISLNQYGSYAANANTVHNLWPNVPLLITEYGSSFNNEDPNVGDVNADSILNNYRNLSFVMGASLWTLNDYRSSYSGTPASENRPWGVVTVWRDKKKGYNSLRAAHSPVKGLSTTHNTGTFSAGTAVVSTITLTPRSAVATDMPAYTMKGYKLAWRIYDNSNNLMDGGVTDIPQLSPGASAWTVYVGWTVPAGGALRMQVTVITPVEYEVYEQNNYFTVPATPAIQSVLVANGQARVTFNKIAGATSYKVKYGTTSLSSTSASTINNFVDITGLTNGTQYQFALVATNGKGDSANSSTVLATPAATNAILPPKMWNKVGVSGGFYAGYSVDSTDTSYSLQYGTTSGSYTTTLSGITNKGATAVTGLTNGTTYYFRMSRTGSGGSSGWSEELSVKPVADIALSAVPQLYGITKGNTQVNISFQTVEKATGYKIKYGTTSGSYPNTVTVNSSVVGQEVVSGLTNGTTYYFVVSSLNANGESANSAEKSVTVGLTLPNPPTVQTLFSDDFESGSASQWTVSSGTWSVVTDGTKVYKQTDAVNTNAVVTAGTSTWTDYTVSAKMKLYDLASLSASGIIGRYVDANNFYMLRLHQSGQIQLYEKVGGTFTMLQAASTPVAINTTYTLKLVFSGSSITGFVDGVQKISVTDSSFSSGKIGVRAYTQTISVDDVLVTAP